MSASIEFDHNIGFSPVRGSLCAHPNGQNYIYCAGGTLVIGNLLDPHDQSFLRKHDDFISAVILSPSGNYIASGQVGENSNVYIWDFNKREILYSFEEHDFKIEAIAFSLDERLITTLGNPDDRKLIVWDLSSGNIVAANSKIPEGSSVIAHGGFLKDIKRRDTQNYQFCTGSTEGLTLWLLDPYNGELQPEPLPFDGRPVFSRQISSLQFYDNNDHICAATTSGDYLIANIRARRIIKAIPSSNLGLGAILAYDAGVITGGGDATIKFFDHSQRVVKQTRVDGAVVSMSFSPDKLEVIAGTASGSVVRLNLDTMQYITLSESHTSKVIAVAFEPGQNDRFATASTDGTIRVWDATEHMVLVTAIARTSHGTSEALPQCLVYTHVLLTGWSDGKILAHDADSGEYLWAIESAHTGGVTALCESHNRRFLISGGQNGEVRLWELRSRELISNFKEHTQKVTALVVFEDDCQALSCSRDRSILRWDLRNERRVFCHTQRMGGLNSIALASDQRTLLSVGQERKITFWDIGNPNPVQTQQINGESDEACCVVLSNDGTLIATGGTLGILYVYDYQSGSPIFRSIAHSGTICSIAFSPDDKQIVSVGEDGSINIWIVFKN